MSEIFCVQSLFPLMTIDSCSSMYNVSESKFKVPARYQLLEPIGQGAYGLVCAALDRTTGDGVAIKKIEKALEHTLFAKRTLRELKILRYLQHENILRIKEVYLSDEKALFDDIYVVSERMETDLASVLKTNQPISPEHVTLFTYQVLRALKYMHSANVIHRDLKPRNLLVNMNCDLKICDFGLSRVRSEKVESLSEYVCTRWYRSPELLLSWSEYTTAIDMWSVGCILGEMLGRRPLFPGQNTRHQMQVIMRVLGTPHVSDFPGVPEDRTRRFLDACNPVCPPRMLKDIFPSASAHVLDLLKELLIMNPMERITASDALKHEYLAGLHCEQDEPVTSPPDADDFAFEVNKLGASFLREELFKQSSFAV